MREIRDDQSRVELVLDAEYRATMHLLAQERSDVLDGRARRELFITLGDAVISCSKKLINLRSLKLKNVQDVVRHARSMGPRGLKTVWENGGGTLAALMDAFPGTADYDAMPVLAKLRSVRNGKVAEYRDRLESLKIRSVQNPGLILYGGLTEFWLPLANDALDLVSPAAWLLLANDLWTNGRLVDLDHRCDVYRKEWVSCKNTQKKMTREAVAEYEHVRRSMPAGYEVECERLLENSQYL